MIELYEWKTNNRSNYERRKVELQKEKKKTELVTRRE